MSWRVCAHPNSLQGLPVIATETAVSRERDFHELYENLFPAVRAYLARRVEPDHVEDLAANTFMVAWRKLPGGIEDPLPWLYAVAHNEVRAHRRRVVGGHRLTEKLMAHTPRGATVDPPPEPPALAPAFAQLTDKEREAMLLVAFEGLDHAEAGRVAGCSPQTFTVRLSRARKKLRIALAAALAPLLVLAAVALSPTRHETLVQRAFGADGSEILYWRIQTDMPGFAPFTDELWMHVTASGNIDQVRRLRVAGPDTGTETIYSAPYGIDDLTGVSLKDRDPRTGRVRTFRGYGYDDNDTSKVVAILEKAAHGQLDLPVGADGSVRVRGQTASHPNQSQVAITLWLDPRTAVPTRIRWGDGANLWQDARVERFEHLPDDAGHRGLLRLGG
jgi:DNA-directed RNA polymerase specialized sigma24 family protein